MKEDIIKIVAKNTYNEIKEDLKDSSLLLLPWAIGGVLFVSWYVVIIIILFQIGVVAYMEYKELLASDEAAESVLPVQPVEETNVQNTDTSTTETDKKEQ